MERLDKIRVALAVTTLTLTCISLIISIYKDIRE